MATQQDPSANSDDSGINHLVDTARTEGEPDTYAGKRGWTRYQVGMRLDVTTDPGDPAASCPVIMENASGGGLSFWLKRQIPLYTPVYVREFGAANDTEWSSGVVHHCTVGIRGYLIGVAFDDPVPEEAPPNPTSTCSTPKPQPVNEAPLPLRPGRGLGRWFPGRRKNT
ncbi:MAG: hypothetical protein ACYTFA_03270 [Planctomycetota bacterium]|jgi:hypothetical protein